MKPTGEQKRQLNKTFGVCRYLYNLFLATNKERYANGNRFMSANDFDKWVNNVHSVECPWIKEVSSKGRKKAIVSAETAYKRFFKKQAQFPTFKKKRVQNTSFYAPKNNAGDWTIERHRIKIPTIGWVRLKEFAYLPIGVKVTGGTVTQRADRYFVSVTVEREESMPERATGEGIGIDLGIKDFAICSDGRIFKNINKSSAIRRAEKRLKRTQRALSRKYEHRKKVKSATECGSNIAKNVLRVQKSQMRLANMRSAYRTHVVNMLVKTKPAYIAIERLNIKGMVRNRHLSKSISSQGFYDFKLTLANTCRKLGIELREVSPFYPSSKICSCCGNKKVNLSLSERVYVCESCGNEMDRDLNAAVNLMQAHEYMVLT
ncbi:RNA-guided endonuclease InsQ/TnpB family protein [Alicyclobacillus sp. ALC3]|uniref:RNA-guided endonuclease InsQ/TnpB family protein n=1 Tax=Alicyclobacillus sp. ALC3 TaxID=2796143 RepID=UPI002379F131|nr:transposase [Alicyclobacillus sp. ALC3]